jgi:L-aspartate oxidase
MSAGLQTDVLIIGCGLAGTCAALRLAEQTQRQITLITGTTEPTESNTRWAQGGIVGRGDDDSAELLIQDVLRAGAGYAYPPAVETMAREGPELLHRILIDQGGLKFDRGSDGEFLYGLEGAHSRRRILHVGDRTGKAIIEAMHRMVATRPNIQVLRSHLAIDLITFPHHARDPLATYRPPACHGAYVYLEQSGQVIPILARITILATGGLGQIYLNTSNPPHSRGDGLAMAWRAGAHVVNAEYVQFHPTALHMAGPTKVLISEAVRGEGGILLTPSGERFMERYDPQWLELAPRDVVARAIYWEMLANDLPYVHLDIGSHRPAEFIRERFPGIHLSCLQQNIDITAHPIPVVPAAHYFCGGVLVDLSGRSTLANLYAVGEVACTGVHGANRLASTSLLESLVWGWRAGATIAEGGEESLVPVDAVPPWDDSGLLYEADPALVQGDMRTIQNLMWHYVGLVRSEYRLNRALRELRHLRVEIEDFYRKTRLSNGLLGLRNAVQAALIVAHAARHNRSSRGCHHREDGRPDMRNGSGPPPSPSLDLR